jgi:hypothetical protein
MEMGCCCVVQWVIVIARLKGFFFLQSVTANQSFQFLLGGMTVGLRLPLLVLVVNGCSSFVCADKAVTKILMRTRMRPRRKMALHDISTGRQGRATWFLP